jgi:hypothetical protein
MQSRIRDVYIDKSALRGDNIVRYWASNAYSRVNFCLRNYTVETMATSTPNIIIFMQTFLRYFQTHGLRAEAIAQLGKYLYRGIDDQYIPAYPYQEKGFIATSLDKQVAKKFATDGKTGGTLQVFNVAELSRDVPFLLIDERIDRIFHEQEILMLPGTIKISATPKPTPSTYDGRGRGRGRGRDYTTVNVTYTPDLEFVRNILNIPTPKLSQQTGGSENMFELEHTMDDLCGRDIVYYRAIVGRKPEVLSVVKCPARPDDIPMFLRDKIRSVSRFQENILRYIPEVQDLQEYMKTAKPSKRTSKKGELLSSYYPHTAIYDPSTKKVVTLNGLFPTVLYKELVPQGRDNEIIEVIHHHYSIRH